MERSASHYAQENENICSYQEYSKCYINVIILDSFHDRYDCSCAENSYIKQFLPRNVSLLWCSYQICWNRIQLINLKQKME